MRLLRAFPMLSLALSLGWLAGCGGAGGSTVTGEIAYGSAKAVPGEKWTINLVGDGKSFSAEVADDGKFKAVNVAPGEYKVQVTHYPPTDAKTSRPPQTMSYPETWKAPGGPYTLDVSKLKK